LNKTKGCLIANFATVPPGATTLTRLISEVREKATLRLWNKLALIPSAEQRSQLEMLLGPTDCSRLSLLESLKKKGP
jgi:hypothetical protein